MITSSTPVTCEGLSVALGTTPVLRDIGLTLTSGETVALLGGNGSGKTTLLRALLGLVPLAAGRAELFGTPVGAFREWWRVGYVPQRGRLRVASATVEEVVASGRLARRRWFRPAGQDDRAATARALELVNLDHLAHRPVAQLSGGQRQRALIARALASRPDLIVLDEPLAGLDLDTQAGLAAVLGRLKAAGTSILVVLHELGPMAPLLDDAIMLRDGRVLYHGPLAASEATTGHEHPDEPWGRATGPIAPFPLLVPDGGAR